MAHGRTELFEVIRQVSENPTFEGVPEPNWATCRTS